MPRDQNLFDLRRFVEAQTSNYEEALAELRAGRKETHWSWYVFPQIRGLGSSPTSIRFAIHSLAEARAYLEHEILGARLRESVKAMNAHKGMSATRILGDIDAQKFRSCLTLFTRAAPSERIFGEALLNFFDGVPDASTIDILARQQADEK